MIRIRISEPKIRVIRAIRGYFWKTKKPLHPKDEVTRGTTLIDRRSAPALSNAVTGVSRTKLLNGQW